MSRVGEQEAITSFDAATGARRWQQTYDAPYQVNPAATAHGKGPKSTLLVDRGRVYALGHQRYIERIRCGQRQTCLAA